MIALLLAGLATAQHYAFPSSPADYSEFYPTAYLDHGGVTDWNCQSLTYSGHRGNDFGGGSWPGMDAGRDVVAAAPGVVSATNDGEFDRCYTGDCAGGGGFGNYVYIQHPDGNETIYGHLKQWSVQVAVGDEVGCGTLLGEMGSSGYSTGPHVHFQVNNLDAVAQDPFDGACDPGPTHWVDQGVWDGLPSLDCDPWAGCQPVDAISCGFVLDGRNDDPGSTSTNAFWGCTDYARYTGPELSFRFATDLDEPVTVRLTGLSADLDLFLIDDFSCDGRSCNTASTSTATNDEELVFDATAGTEFALVLDGWEGAVTEFHLEVLCDGQLPNAGTGTGTGSGATGPGGTGTGGPSDTGNGSSPRVLPEVPKGCGCASTPELPPLAWPLVLLLGIRRRR